MKKIKRIFRTVIRLTKKLFMLRQEFNTLARTPNARFSISWRDRWLCLGDDLGFTPFDSHYVFHSAWASRVLAKTSPDLHVDISSSLYFVTNVSAFIPVKFYDYRPAELGLSGLTSSSADLTSLSFEAGSIQSLSCMHVVEHVGLGRYGDPIDYDGDLKAVEELKRVVSSQGDLLFVVPLAGEARIQFNAHRIYTYAQVLEMFRGFELIEFSLITNVGGAELIINASESEANAQTYGCGCFHFRKQVL